MLCSVHVIESLEFAYRIRTSAVAGILTSMEILADISEPQLSPN